MAVTRDIPILVKAKVEPEQVPPSVTGRQIGRWTWYIEVHEGLMHYEGIIIHGNRKRAKKRARKELARHLRRANLEQFTIGD
jgi:hypothetical protein